MFTSLWKWWHDFWFCSTQTSLQTLRNGTPLRLLIFLDLPNLAKIVMALFNYSWSLNQSWKTPIGHKSLAPQDRWSFVAGLFTLKLRISAKGSGSSKQVVSWQRALKTSLTALGLILWNRKMPATMVYRALEAMLTTVQFSCPKRFLYVYMLV